MKFFPAGGARRPRSAALAGCLFDEVRFVPTGGIGPAELPAYLQEPSVLAVGGSWMLSRRTIDAGDFDTIRRLTEAAVAAVGRPEAALGLRRRERTVRPARGRGAFDVVALGEVMLRLDPGEGRIRTARDSGSGKAEANTTSRAGSGAASASGRGSSRRWSTTSRPPRRGPHPAGRRRPVADRWVPSTGSGREARNGLNFIERGYGVRGALGVSTAVTPPSASWSRRRRLA